MEPWSEKGGKKAWTRSTAVSERGRPTTISHLPSSPSASLASGFRCNHYVTHPLAFPHWVSPLSPPPLPAPSRLLSSLPIGSRYSTPPLSRRAADRSCARDGSITLARRLLSYSRAVSLFTASSFLTETAHRSHPRLRPLLARRAIAAAYISSLMPGDNTIGQVCERYRTAIVAKLLVILVCIHV